MIRPAASPLRVPAPALGRAVPPALLTGFAVALLGSLLYVLAALAWPADDRRPLPGLLAGAARLAAVLFVGGFVVGLVRRHRPLQDRAFTLVGFLATFFGLAMLLVFFWRLGVEVNHYFTLVPGMVERQNRDLKERVDRAEQIYKEEMAKVRAELDAELANAATDEEKKEIKALFDTDIIPSKEKDLKLTAAEARVAFEQGVRPDTSVWGLFTHFLTAGPSSEPQDAGIYPALLGSLWVALITILFAVPVGVGAALYLEEYRANNWLGRIIQVNINNLAGVPSVVYGILGAFVFVELIFKPLSNVNPHIAARNVLGGGLTLGLLTLPVVIVAAQEAIRAVPISIRQGAYALGATQWQVISRQVLPMSLPGILTGTILALSRAIGEAAPLILFGALLFVNEDPSLFSRFTILPMQIFGWADRPPVDVEGVGRVEIWQANAGLASVILLLALLSLNAVAIYLRNRYQKRVRA